MPTNKAAIVMALLVTVCLGGLGAQPETDGQISPTIGRVEAAKEGQSGSLDELKRLVMMQAEEIKALRQQITEQSGRLKQIEQKDQNLVPASFNPSSPENGPATPLAGDKMVPMGAGHNNSAYATHKNLEEQVRKIGPFRFGGDFRLRFDSILRSSRVLSDGSTIPNVQNNRMRYRFRVNLDTDVDPRVSFHGQLSTGPANNGLTFDQDFSSATARHPFLISEAWVDFHPNSSFSIQAGRLQEAFADNSRFIFDDDVRFNGFNEKFLYKFDKPIFNLTSIELRGGQYIFSNPNVAVIKAGDPLALSGDRIGARARAAQMFHQGILFNQNLTDKMRHQFGGDVQLYRNPNQIALASVADSLALIVESGLGLRLSGPLSGTGTATTTPGGTMYTAKNFQIARLTYSLKHKGIDQDERWPVEFNVQMARNMGTSFERDAVLAALSFGQSKKRGDWRFMYLMSIKGANSMISQLTDDDLGTIVGTNIHSQHLRVDYTFSKRIVFQSLFFLQNELRSSGQHPNFFVPLGALAPRQMRFQQQLLFNF